MDGHMDETMDGRTEKHLEGGTEEMVDRRMDGVMDAWVGDLMCGFFSLTSSPRCCTRVRRFSQWPWL